MAKNEMTPEKLKAQNLELAAAIKAANEEVMAAGAGGFTGSGGHRGIFGPGATTVHGGFQDHNHSLQVKNMREADKAYREVGVVRNVIDIMTDFASEGLEMSHPIAAQERFYQAWAKKVNIQEVTRQLLQGMYKWGNVGLFRFWGKVRPTTRKEMMSKARELFAQGKDKEATKAFFRDNKKFQKSRIPVRYSCIPPFRIRIHGTVLFNDRHYWYHLSSLDRQKLLTPEQSATELERKLMRELTPEVREDINRDGLVVLPEDNFQMLHYKRDCSRLWADPLILPIMDDLRYKKLLRRLDMSVAESIINPITVFKLGKTVEGFAPTKEMFQNLATLLKTPVATKTLVWSDLIEVEQHVVDAKEVLTSSKYDEVNDSILAGLGVASVLINGGNLSGGKASGGFAGAFLSVRTLLERLEDARTTVLRMLNQEVDHIRKAMGWKTSPFISWNQISLKDEAAEKRIVMDLLDRKVISAETALNFMGFNNEVEFERKKSEDKKSDKTGIVHSVGPYEEAVRVQNESDPGRLGIGIQEKQLEQNAEFKDKDIEHQQEMAKEANKVKQQQAAKPSGSSGPRRGPGRPANKGDESTRKQKKSRSPSVTGSVEPFLVEAGLKTRENVEAWWKPRYLESLSKANLRQLSAEEKATYNSCILAIYTEISLGSSGSAEQIEQAATTALEGGLRIDADFMSIRAELVDAFRTEHGRRPVLKELKVLESTAYTIHRQVG